MRAKHKPARRPRAKKPAKAIAPKPSLPVPPANPPQLPTQTEEHPHGARFF